MTAVSLYLEHWPLMGLVPFDLQRQTREGQSGLHIRSPWHSQPFNLFGVLERMLQQVLCCPKVVLLANVRTLALAGLRPKTATSLLTGASSE